MKHSNPLTDRLAIDMQANDAQPIGAGTAIAVMAAGRAVRFGGGKLDADLCGRPVGKWVTDAAQNAGFTRRLIIVGKNAPDFVAELNGWEMVVNPAANGGTEQNRDQGAELSSSIRMAADAAKNCERLVLVLADMPLIEVAHLRRLAKMRGIVLTSYPDEKRGVPAAFPARHLEALSNLSGPRGAAAMDWGEKATYVKPSSDFTLSDVDRSSDIGRIAAFLGCQDPSRIPQPEANL